MIVAGGNSVWQDEKVILLYLSWYGTEPWRWEISDEVLGECGTLCDRRSAGSPTAAEADGPVTRHQFETEVSS